MHSHGYGYSEDNTSLKSDKDVLYLIKIDVVNNIIQFNTSFSVTNTKQICSWLQKRMQYDSPEFEQDLKTI